MDAFVTGGSGFIGGHVVARLVERGAHVRCLVRRTSRTEHLRALGVELVEGDVLDGASVRSGMAGADVVFHCAADYRLFASEPDDVYRTNIEGTDNVMSAASELGVRRVVHTSSVATLAPSTDGTPVDERARAGVSVVIGDYKRSKLLAERAVERWAARGLPVVIVNPAAPVGEADAKPTPTGQIVVDFLNGRIPAYVDTGLNVIDVRDVAEGHVLAAERGRAGASYILGNVNLTLRQILELVGRAVGRRAPRIRLPVWLPLVLAHVEAPIARRLGRPPRVSIDAVRMSMRKMFFDATKAVRELGLPQSPVEPAIERSVRWFVDHGFAPRPQVRC